MPGIERLLVVHPDPATRGTLEQAARRVLGGRVAVYHASAVSQAIKSVAALEPQVIVLDLAGDSALALTIARELRRSDRLILGLFNPLLQRDAEADFFRAAARAGIADFLPLPASDAELKAALDAAGAIATPREARREGRVLSFVSHKGGVGKTTLAVNLACLLCEGSERGATVLFDAVLRFGNAAIFLGLAPDRDVADLVRDLDHGGTVTAYCTAHPTSGLLLLASPRDPLRAEQLEPDQLSRVLLALRRAFSTIVVDCPAQLDATTLSVLDLSDAVYVVTESFAPTILATRGYLELLGAQGIPPDRVRVVLNRHSEFEGGLDLATVERQLGRRPDFVFPVDRGTDLAARQGVPYVLGRIKGELGRGLRELALQALGPDAGPPPVREPA